MKDSFRVSWILIALVILASCAAGSESASPGTSPRAAGPSPRAESSPATEKCGGFASGPQEPAPADADSNGTQMAFIVSVDSAAMTLTFDVVQWLSGEEANEAYRRESGDDSDAPNDYYIANESPKPRTLEVTEGACIAIFETGDPNSDKSLPDLAALSQFLDTWRAGRPSSESPSEPFRITTRSGRITAIQQQWRP